MDPGTGSALSLSYVTKPGKGALKRAQSGVYGGIPITLVPNWLRQGYLRFSASLGHTLSPERVRPCLKIKQTGTDRQTEESKVDTCLRKHSQHRKCYCDKAHKDLGTDLNLNFYSFSTPHCSAKCRSKLERNTLRGKSELLM